MYNAFNIKDKVALVTGANRGIGESIVHTFIKNGASKIYAAVRNPESATSLIEKYGAKIVPIQVDLSKPESIIQVSKIATDVEVVVNNAGVLKIATPLDEHTIESFKYELDVNVFGLIHMAQAFSPILKANGGGAFIQLNSVASLKNFPDFATYCASKAASYSITQALKDKLKTQGTYVLSVHPGPIATDMANEAGMADMGEPVSVVSNAIIESLRKGDFHCFPDSMAKQFEQAYEGFSKNIIENDFSE